MGDAWAGSVLYHGIGCRPSNQAATQEVYGKAYSPTVIAEVSRFLFEERNIYVPSDKFGVWCIPPLVVTHSEIDWITEAIDEALLRVDQQLGL